MDNKGRQSLSIDGIALKKKHGQNFLQDAQYLTCIFDNVTLTPTTSVFEIGGGEGFLTRAILEQDIARLWVYEIDPDWAEHLTDTINDDRLKVELANILDIDFESTFAPDAPWTLIANLPYHVTMPILRQLYAGRHLLREGVVMMQEEFAQKVMTTRGRGYGYVSLFFQWYFEWRLLDKVPPTAFYPQPKVFSRLIHFKPLPDRPKIPDEVNFWKFIKVCFKQPRRTLRNNLAGAHYDISDEELLNKRAQQLSMQDLLVVWDAVRKH